MLEYKLKIWITEEDTILITKNRSRKRGRELKKEN
jgi:hypothetical protein